MKAKQTRYEIIKTKRCKKAAYNHYNAYVTDEYNVGVGGRIMVRMGNYYGTGWFKSINRAYQAAQKVFDYVHCGCKAEVRAMKQ
jgi:hypothetical protein